MKVLTLNFLTCAVKTCKASSDSFPLHPKDAELVSDDVELNPQLLVNLLPRIDWNALRTTSSEASVSFSVSIPKSRMDARLMSYLDSIRPFLLFFVAPSLLSQTPVIAHPHLESNPLIKRINIT